MSYMCSVILHRCFLLYRDLLNKDQTKKYELRENTDIGVYVKDLSSFVCKSVKEIEQVMFIGNQNRKIGCVCNTCCALNTGCGLNYVTKCCIDGQFHEEVSACLLHARQLLFLIKVLLYA